MTLPVRRAARVILLDADGRTLLFRYAHRTGPLAGQVYWTPPGGGVDPGESFAEAAVRELAEETGLLVADVGPEIARREFALVLPDGQRVWADERTFMLRVEPFDLSREGWTELERDVLTEARWWSPAELTAPPEQVWPENLAALIATAPSRG